MLQKCLSSCLICLLFGLPESNLNMFKHRCQSNFFCHTKAWPSLPKSNPNNPFLTQHKPHTAWPPKVRPKDDGVQIALKENSQCLRSPCLVGNFCFVEFLEIFWLLRHFTPCFVDVLGFMSDESQDHFRRFHRISSSPQGRTLLSFDVFPCLTRSFPWKRPLFLSFLRSASTTFKRLEAFCGTLTDCEKSLPLGRLVKQDAVGELTERSRLNG